MIDKIEILIFFLFLLSNICYGQLFYEFPKEALSFCTYRMNYTNFFGCNSIATGNIGNVLVIRSLREMQFQLSQLQEDSVVFVVPPFIFASKSIIMQMMTLEKYISGVIVMEPDYCTDTDSSICPYEITDVPDFTEANMCDDKVFLAFSGTLCNIHKMFGYFDYLTLQWPFPLIFLYRQGDAMQNIIDCYENYNAITSKGQKCKMVITSFTPYKVNSENCLINLNSFDHFIAEKLDHCVELSGNNIYITFNKVIVYDEQSIILIITKMDSVSMFDTASAGTMELYPTISLVMYMVGLFHSASESINKNADILLGFLDNDSVDNIGSLRMIYDLKNNQVSNGIANISNRNIRLIISLTDFSNVMSKNLYIFLNKCEDKMTSELPICTSFINILRKATKKHSKSFYLYKFNSKTYSDPWVDNFNVPVIIIRSSVRSKAKYRESFLDRIPPSKFPYLKNLAILLAETILKMVQPGDDLSNLMFTKYFPNDMMNCFYRISCPLMKGIIGPIEKAFYTKNADPFIAQSFVDGEVNMKQGEYTNRLSYFVLKMLIYYFHISFKEDKNCLDLLHQYNFTITIMDKRLCFHTRIQVMKEFNPLHYSKNIKNFSLPIRFRSNVVMKQSVKLFVAVDSELQTTAMVFTTLISSLCFVGSIFLYRSINIIIPPEIF